MKLDFMIKRPAALVLAGLCASLLVCEAMRLQADEADLRAHQARFDCLVRQTAQVPRCVQLLTQGPRDDADFCEAAVARCKAGPSFAGVAMADARQQAWFRRAAWLRMALLLGVVGSVAWAVAGQFLRRQQQTRHAVAGKPSCEP